jgi:hypothetical protein
MGSVLIPLGIAIERVARHCGGRQAPAKFATMDRSAPLPALRNQKPTSERAAKLAHDWQLNKLAERLEGLAEDAA